MLSKLLCKLGIHNWISSKEDFKLTFRGGSKPNGMLISKIYPQFGDKILTLDCRRCSRCWKKQRREVISSLGWKDSKLSLIEERDRKLEVLVN